MPARSLIGLMLIILGLGFIVSEVSGYPYHDLLAHWWPVFVVLIGMNHLFRYPDRPLGAILVTLFGFALLASTLNLLPANYWHYAGALVLVLLGLWIILPHHARRATTSSDGTLCVKAGDHVDKTVIFGALHLQSDAPRFCGGSISVTAGSVELDLSRAELPLDGAILDLAAFAGSIVVTVPESWPVNLAGTPGVNRN